MPWYKAWEEAFKKSEPLMDAVLITLLIITFYILVAGTPTAKAAWLVYWISP